MDTKAELRMSSRDRKTEFAGLLAQEENYIYRYVRTLVRTRSDAEEVFQEAVLVAWRKFDQFESGTNFRAWVCQIAYFAASSHRRNRGSMDHQLDDEFARAIADEREANVERLDERAWALDACLQKLRQRDRAMLRRRYELSMTAKEIAVEVGRSAMAVHKAMNRIHHALMDCVDQMLRTSEDEQ